MSDAATLALLREMSAKIDELRAVVAPDLAQRAVVLTALRAQFADRVFTAREALEEAARLPKLEHALAPLIGASPVAGLRRLARRLAKLVGKPAGGLVLVCVGHDQGSALYMVQRVQRASLSPPPMSRGRDNGG